MKYILFLMLVLLSGCMTAVVVVDTAASTAVSTGELVVDTIDLITPDIFSDD